MQSSSLFELNCTLQEFHKAVEDLKITDLKIFKDSHNDQSYKFDRSIKLKYGETIQVNIRTANDDQIELFAKGSTTFKYLAAISLFAVLVFLLNYNVDRIPVAVLVCLPPVLYYFYYSLQVSNIKERIIKTYKESGIIE